MATPPASWLRFQSKSLSAAGVLLDLSRIRFPRGYFHDRRTAIADALDAMAALEAGAIANPDEGRMVGHYWLRAPALAPSRAIRRAIEAALAQVKAFAAAVHAGKIQPTATDRFRGVLLIGIGGSALGPQLAADALGGAGDAMEISFLDNTDPDGIDRVILEHLDGRRTWLEETLVIVVSKSGSTVETRNGLAEAQEAFARAGLRFAKHAVAITQAGSKLSKQARKERWLAQFPMWDWVGGRTSETSVVGLLPAALQGIDIDELLRGARDMDRATRRRDPRRNPAMLLALAWLHATGGRGAKDMVVLPYKDRLTLFAKYLQQLVMESLGKERDRHGNVVRQGIAVYGNKGSTDQHSYVQQLREGVPNFFATFIEVLRDRHGPSLEIEPGLTSGDYLLGFLLGTRDALEENGRESITMTIDDVTPRSLGALIALHERAVGFYASLVGVNAYHQPGVEAGKVAAARVIEVQKAAVKALRAARGAALTAEEVARRARVEEQVETVYKVLVHLAANRRGVRRKPGAGPAKDRFRAV